MFGKQEKLPLERNPEEMTTDEKIEEMKQILKRFNDLWASVPRDYAPWIDWSHRPRKIVMTHGYKIERTIL